MLTQNHWLLVLVKSDVSRWEEEKVGVVLLLVCPAVPGATRAVGLKGDGASWDSRGVVWT